ncbi:MAG: hypothetical protein U0518_03190 [Candidatus Gracilibacteria bacterium]
MVITTMSSVRVKAEWLLKEEGDDFKEIILREGLREKRDIET